VRKRAEGREGAMAQGWAARCEEGRGPRCGEEDGNKTLRVGPPSLHKELHRRCRTLSSAPPLPIFFLSNSACGRKL
jgi:hypothetical protein